MGTTLNIPDDERPSDAKIEELTLDMKQFREYAYMYWWKLGAATSELCFGRVGKLIGRSARTIRTYSDMGCWKDRRDEEKRTGKDEKTGEDKEPPGRWLKGATRYRVAKKDVYLLEHERGENDGSLLPIDKFVEPIRAALLEADPRTKEGLLAIGAAGAQGFKDALLEGRVDVSKVRDFNTIVRLIQDVRTGNVSGGTSLRIEIVSAVPRPPEVAVSIDNEAIDAEFVKVKEG